MKFKYAPVHIVLEFGRDPKIHGIYTQREIAEAKKEKLLSKGNKRYIAILKKTPIGPGVPWRISQ